MPASANSAFMWPARPPAAVPSSRAFGSSATAAPQNGPSGDRPPARSQTDAATAPPGRVTRAISRSPATGARHEVYDELGQRGVELAVAEGQLPGDAVAHVDAGMPVAHRLDEGHGRVDRRHRGGAQPRDQLGGEHPRPATDVEHPLPARHAREFSASCDDRVAE